MADKNDAYVYIQGDGETPFYVKMEGEMQPRLAQNYSVLAHLAAGTVHLQILFQQNKYPLQNYTVTVPESGTRNFMLKKVDAENFALVDIDKPSHYLMNNNKDEADNSSISSNSVETVPANNAPNVAPSTVAQVPVPQQNTSNVELKAESPISEPEDDNQPTESVAPKDRFINGVVLGGGGKQTGVSPNNTTASTTIATTPEKEPDSQPVQKNASKNLDDLPLFKDGNTEGMAVTQNDAKNEPSSTQPVPISTNCDAAVSGDEFGNLYANAGKFNSDEDKLQYMRNTLANYCFTAAQIMQLCDQMNAQSAKYECARFLYKRTTDPENYGVLDDLFSSKFLKNKLHNEVMAAH